MATKLVGVDVGCLNHQIPGGMLSNLESQLKTMNMSDRLPKVLKEVIQVRADMGYPPLATPSSQICGAQATVNVLTGKRYGMISKEMTNYCRGLYGMPPGKIDAELSKLALKGKEPDFSRPGSRIAPGLEKQGRLQESLHAQEKMCLPMPSSPKLPCLFLKKYKG